MGTQKGSGYYDIIMSRGDYVLPFYKSVYYEYWQGVLKYFDTTEKIADFGCGNGVFASMLINFGYNFVFGVDFSRVAVKNAIALNNKPFFCSCLVSKKNHENLPEYDCAVIFEALEHIDRDLDVLRNFPTGKKIVFSVPSYQDESHVRKFDTMQDVKNRYGELVTFVDGHSYQFPSGSFIHVVSTIRK